MTILVRQQSRQAILIAPRGFEDDDGLIPWGDEHSNDILVEGWDESEAGYAGPPRCARYELVAPAMFLFDDPYCMDCAESPCACGYRIDTY